jgi:hypothetical protein
VKVRTKLGILVIALTVVLLPALSNAALLEFTSRAAWEAAVTGASLSFADVDIASQVDDFAILAAGTPLSLPFAETLTFDTDLQGRQVPTSWLTWSGGQTPRVLYTGLTTHVEGTFGPDGAIGFGLEMEPNPFAVFSMTLTYVDGTIGSITQFVDGLAGAKFFGWLATTPGEAIDRIALDCDVCDFAFGRMVKAPEPSTLLLLGSGLAGLAAATLRRNRRK